MAARSAEFVLVLGWDAADWQLIEQRIAAGGMANLRGLMERGCHAPLATLEPKLSPLLWTSVVTGMTADKHGVLHFIEPDPAGGVPRISASTTRRTKALWNILTQSGLRTHAVNWYASHPAEPISGSVVSNLFLEGNDREPPGEIPPLAVAPVDRRARIASCRVGPSEVSGSELDALVPGWRKISNDPRIVELRGHLARARSVHLAGLAALESGGDCALIFQEAIDTVGHTFMQFHPPRMPHVREADFRQFRGVMEQLYELHDRMLGELLAAAPEETTVVLLSDHGFHSGGGRPVTEGLTPEQRAATEALWHRDHGILVLAGPGIVPAAVVEQPTLLDIAPTVLALLGLPMGADMDGRVLSEALVAAAPAPIPSWDALDAPAGLHPPELRQDPFDASDAIRQLVALGYLAALPDGIEAQLELIRRETKFNLAMVHVARGRGAPAVEILRELVATRPDESRYVFNLVSNLLNLGRPAECVDVLERLLDAAPRDPDALQLLAAAHLMAGDAGAGRALLATRGIPGWDADDRALRLADLHLLAGDPAAARVRVQRALARDAANPLALVGLAKVEIATGEFEAAAGHCLDALEISPRLADAHHHLGVALAWLGALEHAQASFESALALQPGRIDTLRFLEAIHHHSGTPYDSPLAALLDVHRFDPAQRAILLADHPFGPAAWLDSRSSS